MGAVGIHPMAVDTGRSTDRKKILQITTLRPVRGMRAVFSEVLPARRTPLPSPQFSRIEKRLSEQPQTSFIAEDRALGGPGA
jgi:hypothetical protein